VIRSFRCGETEELFKDLSSRKFRAIERVARLKLEMMEAAAQIDDLRKPPGNRLVLLKGKRAGQYRIRINDQFRICFSWVGGAPEAVEIVDYH